MGKPAARVPELIREWTEIASDELREAGVAAGEEDAIALRVVRAICDAYAGLPFYLPVWTAQRIIERDRLIATAIDNGADVAYIARKHGLHLTTVYAIVRRVKAVDIASRQKQLFDQE
jgi:Mor family transcriptional regulator